MSAACVSVLLFDLSPNGRDLAWNLSYICLSPFILNNWYVIYFNIWTRTPSAFRVSSNPYVTTSSVDISKTQSATWRRFIGAPDRNHLRTVFLDGNWYFRSTSSSSLSTLSSILLWWLWSYSYNHIWSKAMLTKSTQNPIVSFSDNLYFAWQWITVFIILGFNVLFPLRNCTAGKPPISSTPEVSVGLLHPLGKFTLHGVDYFFTMGHLHIRFDLALSFHLIKSGCLLNVCCIPFTSFIPCLISRPYRINVVFWLQFIPLFPPSCWTDKIFPPTFFRLTLLKSRNSLYASWMLCLICLRSIG